MTTQDNTKETEAYFRNLNDMVRSDGWKLFLNEIHASATSINSVEHTKDANDLFFRKGQLAILANILNFETQIANAQDEFESQGNADSE